MMTNLKSHLHAGMVLLALYGGLSLVFAGRARAQQEDCLNVALCNDRRTPFQQSFFFMGRSEATSQNQRLSLAIPANKRVVIEYASLYGYSLTPTFIIRGGIHRARGNARRVTLTGYVRDR